LGFGLFRPLGGPLGLGRRVWHCRCRDASGGEFRAFLAERNAGLGGAFVVDRWIGSLIARGEAIDPVMKMAITIRAPIDEVWDFIADDKPDAADHWRCLARTTHRSAAGEGVASDAKVDRPSPVGHVRHPNLSSSGCRITPGS
jgi:hypothetical protein